MTFWRARVEAGLRPSWLSQISKALCLVAALFMLAGGSYAAAHDHDDHDEHETDYDSVCVVCGVVSLSAAKLAPAEPSVIKPSHTSDQAPNQNAATQRLRIAAYQTARGPPPSSHQH